MARIGQILNLAPVSAPRLALHPAQGEGTLAGNSLMCVIISLHIPQCIFTLAVLILLFHFNATTALTRYAIDQINKLAKARKTRTSPNTLGLKKFGMGKLWSKKFFGSKSFSGQKKFFGSKTFFGSKKFFGSNKFFGSKKFF